MQGRDVSVPDGFFPAGMLADLLDREIDLNEPLWVGRGVGHYTPGTMCGDMDALIILS
jgi:hypothetical protein